jgi:hypothetical protein
VNIGPENYLKIYRLCRSQMHWELGLNGKIDTERAAVEQAGAVDGPVLSQAMQRGKGRADFVVTPLADRTAWPVPVLVPQLTGDVLLPQRTGI